jgi:hypothetical protein
MEALELRPELSVLKDCFSSFPLQTLYFVVLPCHEILFLISKGPISSRSARFTYD